MAVLDTLKGISNIVSGIVPDELATNNKGGFSASTRQTADGDGLPFQKQSINNVGVKKRNIISWLVPEFGIVRMYINPEQITFSEQKLINDVRTKGGYTLQYWGEGLTSIRLSGSTGSAGIEGINALYEIYRAEQLAFDTEGLLIDSQSTTSVADNLAGQAQGFLNNALGDVGGIVGDLFGLNTTNNSLAAQNIPSMAQYAFTVEMYYGGSVYRGFFRNMTITESANNFAFRYDLEFMVTQKRGYRRNYLPFHRNPQGPSSYDSPYTFIASQDINKLEPIE